MDLSIIQGTSKKTGNSYEAIKITVGKWTKLIFVSDFELQYIKDYIDQNLKK